MSFRALAVAASSLVAACFVDKGTSTADPPAATTSASANAAATDATTSTGVVDPTTGGTSTGDATTTLPDPTTTTDATTGVVPPADCWDQDVSSWPLMGTPLELGDIADPFLTADGLRLYYLALPERRPVLSTRAGLFDPFTPGTGLAAWNGLADDFVVSYPIVLAGDQLMLLSASDDIHFSFASAMGQDKFDLPQPLPGAVNTAEYGEYNLTATADAEILIVQRNDGPPLGTLPFTYTFHQFFRAPDDTGYAGGGDVTPHNPPFDFAICPVLSPDGLRMFYTSTVGDSFNPPTFSIHYTTRATLDAPWETPAEVPGLDGAGVVCPTSVTTDGCQLVYYTFGIDAVEISHYLALRAAP